MRVADIAGHRQYFKVNPFIWVVPLALSGIGILMITSTTSPTSFQYTGTPFLVGVRQLKWLGIAMTAMLIMSVVPVRAWYKLSAPIFAAAWSASWLPLLPGIGGAVGGASRWIYLPGVSIQPGELLCLATTLVMAKFLARGEKNAPGAFLSTIIIVTIACLPLIFQPDFGTIVLIFLLSMGMFVEKYGWKWPVLAGGSLAAAITPLLVFGESYRVRRISAFLNPWADPLGKGYQAIQGLIAFANGGFWGAGLGHGFQKLNYLPAAYTDFIYAAIGEELGLMGTLGVLGLFIFWAAQVKKLYFCSRDSFRALLTWGITLTVLMPLIINIAGVTKMMPLTGMPLPFISYGGTSLVTMWARIGVLVRIEKENCAQAAEKGENS